MLTFNPAVSRGASSEVTLEKTALLALVSGDDYFADSSNWKKVVVVYESNSNNQKEILSFDASEALPTASFLISDKSDGDFLLDKVIIRDCDGGSFVIGRSSLESLSLDVVIASGELSVKIDIFANWTDQGFSGIFPFVSEGLRGDYFSTQTFLANEDFSLSKFSIILSKSGNGSGTLSFGVWEVDPATGYPIATNPDTGKNDMNYGLTGLNGDIPTLNVNVENLVKTNSEKQGDPSEGGGLPGYRYEANGEVTWDSDFTYDVEFANPVPLTANTTYALVIYSDINVASSAIFEKTDKTGSGSYAPQGEDISYPLYEAGIYHEQKPSWGSSWTRTSTEDFVFRIFGS